ncbi:MAG: sensor histidine kinase [Dehalococcoidia bacterium]
MSEAAARRSPTRGPTHRLLDLRRPHFWITQALVLVAVGAIYLTESSVTEAVPGLRLPGGLRVAAVALTVIPVMYAALRFGMEAAVLTALWVVALAGPMLVMGGPGSLDRIVEPAILLVVLAIGTVLALRVDAERGARERAEALSARLTLLHEVMQVLAQRAPLPDVLQGLADTIRRGMGADYAEIRYTPADDAALEVTSGAAPAAEAAPGDTIRVPLTGEQATFGELAVVRLGRPYTAEERQVLSIAGLEASSAFGVRMLEDHRRRALEMYARQVTNAQEAERARIARELHDGPLQLLTGLVRAADLIEKERGADAAAFGAAVERLRGMSEAAVTELRAVTRDLRPMTLHRLGLHAALRSLASDVSERSGVAVDLHFDEGPPLPEEVELAIFRIVQEALSNVAKHAQATRVHATISREVGGVRVEVRDDGTGARLPADPSDLAHRGRFGLLGMRERAALFDGTLEVVSPPPGEEHGTAVRVRIPLAP